MLLELELPRVLAPDLSSNCYSMLDGFKYPPLKAPNPEGFGAPISFRCLIICFGIGQFARLLPSVEVVAISPLVPARKKKRGILLFSFFCTSGLSDIATHEHFH